MVWAPLYIIDDHSADVGRARIEGVWHGRAARRHQLHGLLGKHAIAHLDVATLDLLVQLDHRLLDRVAKGVSLDEDLLVLAEPMDTPRRLVLLRRVQRGLE